MGKIKRKFDIQFKIAICQAVMEGSHTVASISRDHQLSRATVDRWIVSYRAGSLEPRGVNREKDLEREVEKLKAKVGELTMANDLLKKMENYKRQEKSANSSIITSSNWEQLKGLAKPLVSPSQAITTSLKNPNSQRK